MEALRLYHNAADGGSAAATERLKALCPDESPLKCTNEGLFLHSLLFVL